MIRLINWFKSRPAFFLVGLALVVRLAGVWSESLWYDEAYTRWIVNLPFNKMLGAIYGDVHPPLFYLVEFVNVRILGDSALSLRLPSVIFGSAIVYLVYRIALDLVGDRGIGDSFPITCGLIACFLPGLLYYSQEARMYSLLTMFVLIAVVGAMEERPAIYAVGSVGAIYSQNLGVLFVGVIGAVWWLREFRSWFMEATTLGLPGGGRYPNDLRAVSLAGLAVIVCWLPWLPVLYHQLEQINKGYWIQPVNIGAVLLPIPVIGWGWRLPDSLQINVYTVAFAGVIMGLFLSRSWLTSPRGRFILAGALGTPTVAGIYSLSHQSIYLPRAFLPAITLLIPVMGYALVATRKLNRIIALILFVPALLAGVYFHYFPAIGGRFPAESWANTINEGWRSGDIVYHMGIDTAMIYKPYLVNQDYAVLPHFSDLNQALTEETKSYMGFNQWDFDSLVGRGYIRAWLVVTENRITNTTQMSEVNRILAQYPYTVARQIDDGYLNESIYIVNLIAGH